MKVPKLLKSVRYMLAAVNCVFLVTGLIFLIVGIIVLVTYNNYDSLLTNRFFALPGFMIATAVIIFFVSVLGFYGAISEHFYFIVGYVALLLIILIFEISITVMGFGLEKNAASEIRSPMLELLRQYERRREASIIWDDLQIGFGCCGIAGQNDWTANRLPVSCCEIPFGTVSPFLCTTNNSQAVGCQTVFSDWLGYYAFVIGVTAAFVICLQVLIVAASGWLAYRSRYEEVVLEQ